MNRTLIAITIILGQVVATSACAGNPQRVNGAGVTAEQSAATELAGQEAAAATAARADSVSVVLAAIDHVTGTPSALRPHMLSSLILRTSTPHDSAMLAAVSRSFVRVINPRASQIIDTALVTFGIPVRQSGGYLIGVEIGGLHRCPNGRISGSSTTYQLMVRCTPEVCTPERLSAWANDGFCRQQTTPM